jgi:hypothetical protein
LIVTGVVGSVSLVGKADPAADPDDPEPDAPHPARASATDEAMPSRTVRLSTPLCVCILFSLSDLADQRQRERQAV